MVAEENQLDNSIRSQSLLSQMQQCANVDVAHYSGLASPMSDRTLPPTRSPVLPSRRRGAGLDPGRRLLSPSSRLHPVMDTRANLMPDLIQADSKHSLHACTNQGQSILSFDALSSSRNASARSKAAHQLSATSGSPTSLNLSREDCHGLQEYDTKLRNDSHHPGSLRRELFDSLSQMGAEEIHQLLDTLPQFRNDSPVDVTGVPHLGTTVGSLPNEATLVEKWNATVVSMPEFAGEVHGDLDQRATLEAKGSGAILPESAGEVPRDFNNTATSLPSDIAMVPIERSAPQDSVQSDTKVGDFTAIPPPKEDYQAASLVVDETSVDNIGLNPNQHEKSAGGLVQLGCVFECVIPSFSETEEIFRPHAQASTHADVSEREVEASHEHADVLSYINVSGPATETSPAQAELTAYFVETTEGLAMEFGINDPNASGSTVVRAPLIATVDKVPTFECADDQDEVCSELPTDGKENKHDKIDAIREPSSSDGRNDSPQNFCPVPPDAHPVSSNSGHFYHDAGPIGDSRNEGSHRTELDKCWIHGEGANVFSHDVGPVFSGFPPYSAEPVLAMPQGATMLDQLREMEAMRKETLLSDAQWACLRRVFERLRPDGCREVSTQFLLSELRADPHVVAFLDNAFCGVGSSSAPRVRTTTVRQALNYVQHQSMPTVTWQVFSDLLCEAPRHRRLTISELLEAVEVETGIPSFDPNRNPIHANNWLELKFGISAAMLNRLYNRFSYCQRSQNPFVAVPRGTLVKSIKSCEDLLADFQRTSLRIPGAEPPKTRIRNWSDVIVDLECHEYDAVTWADVLEVVRWNRELELGVVSPDALGPSGHIATRGTSGPPLRVSPHRARLVDAMASDSLLSPNFGRGHCPARHKLEIPASPKGLPRTAGATTTAQDLDPESRADQIASVFARGISTPIQTPTLVASAPIDHVPAVAARRLKLRIPLPGGGSDARVQLSALQLQLLENAVREEAAKILGLPLAAVRLSQGSKSIAAAFGTTMNSSPDEFHRNG